MLFKPFSWKRSKIVIQRKNIAESPYLRVNTVALKKKCKKKYRLPHDVLWHLKLELSTRVAKCRSMTLTKHAKDQYRIMLHCDKYNETTEPCVKGKKLPDKRQKQRKTKKKMNPKHSLSLNISTYSSVII